MPVETAKKSGCLRAEPFAPLPFLRVLAYNIPSTDVMIFRSEVPLRMPAVLRQLAVLVFLVAPLSATDVFGGPSFSIDPAALRAAADAIKPGKHSEATVLLNDVRFTFDGAGKLVETTHLIYRVENQDGVQNWAEVSGQWEAWHQAKPEIKARVITADGAVHWIDPKTLNDVPVHENVPEMYTDERRYGGPLPAVAIGAIVEEEVSVRDSAPLFTAGVVFRWTLGWSVPVNKTHVVISHAEALPLRYQVHLLPDASIAKSHENGMETITLDQGALPAYHEQPDHLPPDVVIRPEVEFATGTSWQQIASAYAGLSNDKVRTADVQLILSRLNLQDGTRQEIIRRIVAALHKNIRYTGVEFGESSLVPQFPSETLKRKYGDCKDKATLLVAMLRAEGIPANLALLDTGPGRDINPDLPGIGLFDHAIVYVPASGSNSDLWIDATAEYSQVGTLPWMDYGRSALIIAEGTDSLKKTPELTAEQNLHRELRVFTLPEYGNATIAEIDDEVGPEEADYRQYYSADSKEVRKNSEEYVKDMYLAESLASMEHGDLTDLEKPATIKFVTKGRRGNTDLEHAVVAIRTESLFDRLPKYFRTPEEPKKTASASEGPSPDDDEKPEQRAADWRITPFVTEWRYEVTAPAGFRLRALPSEKHDKVDVLTFDQQYSSNPEGTMVKAVLRVECSTSRMTVEQARNLRDAVVKAREADPIFISFDNLGQSLIAAGKIKEGLAAYRQIAAQHPKEALHKVQLARALLSAGLGEEAREEAKAATALEPKSALAFSTLGLVLKHDQIGRLLKKGMDFDGSVAAYKKATALDPTDKENLAELGLLLEYDADGIRYSESGHLQDAVTQMQALKKLDPEYARTYDDNVLYDLWYAHDFQGVLDLAATLPTSDVRKGLMLASIAVLQGVDAAVKKSVEITTDEKTRSQALINAGSVLMRVRKYQETAAMFREAARGQSTASQIGRSAEIFANTRAVSERMFPANDPRSVVQQLFALLFSGKATLPEFKSLIYVDPQTDDFDEKHFQEMMSTFRAQMQVAALPLPVIADLTISNMKYSVDGDDSLGYKIIIEAAGAAPQDVYVVRDGSQYKIAAFSANKESGPEQLAFPALVELQKKNLAAARKWLDRARDKIHMGGGDDPLDGSPFPHFWTKGQEADASTIQLAALVLLPSKQLKAQNLAIVKAARDAAKTDLDRARLSMVLAYASLAQQHWDDLLSTAEGMIKAFPMSLRAFDLAEKGYAGLRRFDDWSKLAESRRAEHPEELAYVRSAARIAAYRGQFENARSIIKSLIDKGQANSEDLNLYAWFALALANPIDQEAIDTAIRATDLSKDSFAIQHTLGCVYAQAGKTSQARELLLKAMDDLHLEEPNSEIWFGFGLIAEQYGILDAAQKMFGRVEKPEMEYPASSYALAQKHLADLKNSAGKLSASR